MRAPAPAAALASAAAAIDAALTARKSEAEDADGASPGGGEARPCLDPARDDDETAP